MAKVTVPYLNPNLNISLNNYLAEKYNINILMIFNAIHVFCWPLAPHESTDHNLLQQHHDHDGASAAAPP